MDRGFAIHQAPVKKSFLNMTAKHAVLLTVLMISAIAFMAVGIFTVDAGSAFTSSDGYGISSAH